MFGWLKSFLESLGLVAVVGIRAVWLPLFNEIGAFDYNIIAGPKQVLLAILSQLVVMLFKSMTFGQSS